MITKEAILDALSGVEDPELKRPLTDLDMIKTVTIDNDKVTIQVALTVPSCPLKDRIVTDVSNAISKLEGVRSVEVELGTMTDAERAALRTKLGHEKPGGRGEPTIEKFAKRFICVASGKGGVGKSTVTANLAAALARKGYKVGLLDADVYGFSIPRMLGVSGQPTLIDDKIVPLRCGDNIQVMSIGFFVGEDEPVIWRGPLLHKAINQFLADAMWDQLDYLFLDLPPGTGDVSITIAQAIPSAEMLVVTTPQVVATNVASRVAKMAESTKLRVIGVVENMAYYDVNGKRDYIFGQGGGKALAEKLNVPLIGEIPLSKAVREGSDKGQPVAEHGDPAMVQLFDDMSKTLVATGSP